MSDHQPEPVPAPESEASEPGLREKLYKVPVLGAIIYFLAPPRTGEVKLWRRALSWTSGVAAILGIGMVLYPYAGDKYPFFLRIPVEKGIEWSNFFSDLESNKIQDNLAGQFNKALASKKTLLGEGDPLTQLEIPKIGVDVLVVEGTSISALKAGAGHYPSTPLPGQAGNVSIAGHRTTYGRPFNRIEELKPGDQIILTTPKGKHTYQVTKPPWITTALIRLS